MTTDRSGQFMVDLWDFDPNARHVEEDDEISVSLPPAQLPDFETFLNARGWRIVRHEPSPGGTRRFLRIRPEGM